MLHPGLTGIGGLSPRVRGNLDGQLRLCRGPRSIPACAGEPGEDEREGNRNWVYPRVCGGTCSARWGTAGGPGLSPRVRGNRARLGLSPCHTRSIPACAGEPAPDARPDQQAEVYPRVCGGTASLLVQAAGAPGLSPRVRGNLYGDHGGQIPVGSIPACAGEPGTPADPASGPRVYPRVCGGTYQVGQEVQKDMGLSPRVRGNHEFRLEPMAGTRSIPACAGEPWTDLGHGTHPGVYPRVCGGTTLLPWCLLPK